MKLQISTLALAISMIFSACAHKQTTELSQETKLEYTGNEDRYPAGGGPGEEALQSLIKTLSTASKKSEATVASVLRNRIPEAENLGKSGYKIKDEEQLKIVEKVNAYKAIIAKDLKVSSEAVEQASATASAGKSYENVWSTRAKKAEVTSNSAKPNDTILAKVLFSTKLDTESKVWLEKLNNKLAANNVSVETRERVLTSAAKAAEAAKQPVIKESCNDIINDGEALSNSTDVTDMIPGEINSGRTPAQAMENSLSKKFHEDTTAAKERCVSLCKDPCFHYNCNLCGG